MVHRMHPTWLTKEVQQPINRIINVGVGLRTPTYAGLKEIKLTVI
jgi:hypothetical protein